MAYGVRKSAEAFEDMGEFATPFSESLKMKENLQGKVKFPESQLEKGLSLSKLKLKNERISLCGQYNRVQENTGNG